MGEAVAGTRKITIEVEVPEGLELEDNIEKLVELLRKGAPLGVRRGDISRARIYADRTRY